MSGTDPQLSSAVGNPAGGVADDCVSGVADGDPAGSSSTPTPTPTPAPAPAPAPAPTSPATSSVDPVGLAAEAAGPHTATGSSTSDQTTRQNPIMVAAAPGPVGYSPPRGLTVGWNAAGDDQRYDPELEGSSYQTAPITSLALARWTWAVAGLLIGILLGFLSANGGGFQATTAIEINSNTDSAQVSTIGTALVAKAGSHTVLAEAAKQLRASAMFAQLGGTLPAMKAGGDDTAAIGVLNGQITAAMADKSNMVSISAVDPNGKIAVLVANAVAQAVKAKNDNDADQLIKDYDVQRSRLMSSVSPGAAGTTPNVNPGASTGTVTADPMYSAQAQAIGQEFGTRKAAAVVQKLQIKVIPTTEAFANGPDQNVSALLGGAGGAFLGALAAVAAGAGRRRPHSPRELMSLAPDLVVRTTVQAGELAGRILETDRRTVVVLAMPDTRFASTQLSMAIAHHLRTHGVTVAFVDRVSDFSPGSASEDRLWALRRDVRRNVYVNFGADMLVVVCGAEEEALSLIAGQSDLLVAVVAKQRKTVLADIRRTIDAVRISEPVVVLSR